MDASYLSMTVAEYFSGASGKHDMSRYAMENGSTSSVALRFDTMLA
jgi:hypothetical protein